jgi:acetyltransferase-like isoleucine patch superfamily enzyme
VTSGPSSTAEIAIFRSGADNEGDPSVAPTDGNRPPTATGQTPLPWHGERPSDSLDNGLGAFAPTTIGARCRLLTRTYVAHDCVVGDDVTTSAASLSGHVQIGHGANLGMNATVHVVGPSSMVGMSAVVTRDVPPFALSYGNPARAVRTRSR